MPRIEIDHFDDPDLLRQELCRQLGLRPDQIRETGQGRMVVEVPEDAVDFDFGYFRDTVEDMPYANTARVIEH